VRLPASHDETAVRVAAAALEVMRAHAGRDAPRECCGLLIGEGLRALSAWPARNLAAVPETRYDVDPADHFAALRHARERRLEIVGAYHSHPRSTPQPSETDRCEAHPDFIYLIVGLGADGSWTSRAFLLMDGNFQERPLVFEP